MTSTAPSGTSTDLPPIVRHLPPAPDPDALLDGFVDFVTGEGISLYEAQESAILELLAGNNVILNTPTGSGKSLVAAAAHFVALADNRRSFYTAPIKALVSEKFFSLCRDFGAERVGMITGDASVNPEAPIICCTAEILANLALRDGANADVDVVIMDEFHYYADPQRGWAWQLPLLELGHCQFLLLSATLGRTEFFEEDLTRRTGRETVLVASADRPVPLEFEYRHTTLHQSISELLETDRAPIYLVHFTQREATEAAQSYLSLDPLSKTEKDQVREAIGGFRFDSPIGKDLRRYVMGGVGVHHAGLLPKYRLLVEKLAQDGLLKIICGTDTLGVGVNVPIRSVLFTQLCKYDGQNVRLLSNREFAQIAGRAGRKGFDTLGHVFVQAPPHVVENLRADEKAAADPKRRKKAVKKKQPDRGYAHWTEDSFKRMRDGDPEPLTSSFRVNHQMVLTLLDRAGDGCGAVRQLLTDNHETRKRQRGHIKRTISIYRSLVDADLLETLDEPDEDGRLVRVMLDLQNEFALHQPLSLWAIEAIGQVAAEVRDADSEPTDDTELDDGAVLNDDTVLNDGAERDESAGLSDEEHALVVLSIIESILESPGVVIAAQINLAKGELVAELKSRGVEYDERMERLAEVEAPKPHKEWIYHSFDSFRVDHPWVGSDNVAPKSIVRDMYEQVMTFREYVQHYGLKRSEGVLLRYLSDAYKALIQNIPEDDKTDAIVDLTEWLGEVVRHVDSSLIDEWDRLRDPDDTDPDNTDPDNADPDNTAGTAEPRPPTDEHDILANRRAFTVMVRNEAFRLVTLLARKRPRDLPVDDPELLDEIAAALDELWDEHDEILLDADARSPARFLYDHDAGTVTQIIHDPEDIDEWRLVATVDADRSREEGKAVLALGGLVRA
ncbi:MAG: DEAD/DEAH box helicase [Acidimicrobiales bacterium]